MITISTLPSMSLSSAQPQTKVASSEIISSIYAAACCTSKIPRSSPEPEVMFMRTPLAPCIEHSIRGLSMASLRACSILFSPLALPTPMTAIPACFITAFRSAKSTLTRPGRVTRSVTPCTACLRISSTIEKDSLNGVSLLHISRSLSLGTTIRASTLWRSLAIPSSA